MQGMQPDDLYELTAVGEVRVSPDGRTIAFAVTSFDRDANDYRSRIWVTGADGGQEPRPLTEGERRENHPRWSPDGAQVAYACRAETPERSQLCVVPAGGGGALVLAELPEDVEDLAWSPGGDRLAFVTRVRDERRYSKEKPKDQPPRRIDRLVVRVDSVGWTMDRPRHLFVVEANGSAPPRALTEGEWDDAALAWSPAGYELAFTSARHGSWDCDLARDIFVVAAAGGEPRRVTETGPEYAAVTWSADGSMLAFAVDPEPLNAPRHARIGVVATDGTGTRLLTAGLDRHAFPYPPGRGPLWVGDDLYFRVEDGGNVHLCRVATDGARAPEQLVGGERQIGDFDHAGGTLAFSATGPTHLAELFVVADGEERRLTDVGRAFRQGRSLMEPQAFTAVSHDGTEVPAWIMRPAPSAPGQRHPVLLVIHGGPFTQYGARFFDEFQVFAGAGYAVLYANPRGSSGYSEAWGRAIRGPKAAEPGSGWGGVDYEDLMAVVDDALRRFDDLDGERMGVLGGSYGGYMTTWIAAHTSRFRAACSERACNNLLTMSYTSDYGPFMSGYLGVTHLEDAAEYLRQSPMTYVKNISTPMLILHSEDDLRCPIEQAEQLYVALKLLGREVEFVRFPGESHELSRSGAPAHRVERFRIILDWFDRHLKVGD
ncbi:MAG TPA: S9 family peptidase [Candidatus Dormibacteraeota bacterium]